MINARAIDKIARHVDDAVSKGAEIATGGLRIRDAVADGPNYYAPTVLINANSQMELCNEETFGPVAPIFRFTTEAQVIEMANDTPFGDRGHQRRGSCCRDRPVWGCQRIGVWPRGFTLRP